MSSVKLDLYIGGMSGFLEESALEGTRLVFCSTMHSSLVYVLMLAAQSLMYPWLLWREFCRPVSSIAFNYIHKVAWVHSSIHKQNATLAREHFEAKYSGVQWCCSKCTPDLLCALTVSPLACYTVLLAHQVDIWHSVVEFQIFCKSRHTCVQPKTSDSSQPLCHGLWACTLIWGAVKTKLIHSKWWLGGIITFCPDPNHNPDSTLGMFCIFRYALML